MTTTYQPVEAAPKPVEQRPHVLPEERPLEMPHQDMAISPVVTNIVQWLRLPGDAIRNALSFRRRRETQETHHVA